MFDDSQRPRGNSIRHLVDEVRFGLSLEFASWRDVLRGIILTARVFGVLVMCIHFSLGGGRSAVDFPSTSLASHPDERSSPDRPLEFGFWRYDEEGYLVRQRQAPVLEASIADSGANRFEGTLEKLNKELGKRGGIDVADGLTKPLKTVPGTPGPASLQIAEPRLKPEKSGPLPAPSPLARAAGSRKRELYCADRQYFRSYADCKEYQDQLLRQAVDFADSILKAPLQAGTDEPRLTPEKSKRKTRPPSMPGRAPGIRPRARFRFR